jgi:hypothetical protein
LTAEQNKRSGGGGARIASWSGPIGMKKLGM